MVQVENGSLVEKPVPMRNAMNELLRDEYIKDCERVVKTWNRASKERAAISELRYQTDAFFRRQRIYAGHFDLEVQSPSLNQSG